MPFVLIAIGLVLIYFGLKNNKNIYDNNKKSFNNVLGSQMSSHELDEIREQMGDIYRRVDEIENSLILLNDNVNKQEFEYQLLDAESERGKAEINELQINDNIVNVDSGSSNDVEFKEKEIESETNVIDKYIDINKQIYDLVDSGRSIDEVSSVLQVGKGEILLRLGLRKSRI